MTRQTPGVPDPHGEQDGFTRERDMTELHLEPGVQSRPPALPILWAAIAAGPGSSEFLFLGLGQPPPCLLP